MYVLMILPYYLMACINIHKYADYANTTICKIDHKIKGLCLSLDLVPILVVYDIVALEILLIS